MLLPPPTRRAVLPLLALGLALPAGVARAAGPPRMLRFRDLAYFHRWEKDGQHEFTPEAETDLARWTNMLTINLHRAATGGEQLAEVANRIVGNYRQHGRIVKTASKPATPGAPAEHLIVAIFGRPAVLEAAFTRIHLVNGTGFATTYSRRVYGENAGPAMSEWLAAQGQATETALMAWSDPAAFGGIAAV